MKYISTIILIVLLSSLTYADDLLVGKTFTHSWTNNSFPKEWPTPKYETRFCNNDTLVWNNITDTKNISSGVEKYSVTRIAPGILQVSLKESPEPTNYGIVWTLNFNNNDIYGVSVNIDP